MSDGFVSLADYMRADGQFALNGFGSVTQGALDDLNKALGTSGTGTDGTAFADGTALRPESLEGTLKTVTFKEQHIKFWKQIHKKPAYNTVEEFNKVDSYGVAGSSVFFEEGGLPLEDDSRYSRETALVKFLGTTRVLTHPMTLVNTYHGDILTRETMNGTLHLLRQLEDGLFYADSSLNPNMFDGMMKLIMNGGHVIDLRGKTLDQDFLEDGAQRVLDNYGNATKLFAGTKNISDVSRSLFDRQRIVLPSSSQGMTLGNPVNGFASNAGVIEFEPTTFLRPGRNAPTAASSDKAPNAPTVAAAVNAPSVTNSQWDDNTVANRSEFKTGTHYWGVSSVGDAGESAIAATSGTAVAAGGAVTLTITHPTAGYKVRHYRIYRGTSAGTMKFVKAIAKTGGSSQTWQDLNANLPGTNNSFLLDMDGDQSFSWRQLAPMMKIPLATIAASIRFMILLYGTPIMYNPRRNVIYINVGSIGPDSSIQPYGTL